jgi:hypothetical protein
VSESQRRRRSANGRLKRVLAVGLGRQVSLVHSWDTSEQGAATHAQTLAAVRARVAAALPTTSWLGGSSQTLVLRAPLETLNSTIRWLTQQEVSTPPRPSTSLKRAPSGRIPPSTAWLERPLRPLS